MFPLRTDAFHLAQVLQGETLRDVDVTLDRQGQELALILNAGPLLSGQQILGCVVTLTDITERKRATEAEARLAAILEATPDLVGIADPEGQFVYMNRAGRKMLGIDERTELTRHNIREFHDAANAHVVLTEGIPTAMREGAWTGETVLVALDGHAIATSQVILAHKAPNGTVPFVSTIARDITERKRADVTLRSSEKRFRALVEHSADFVSLLALDGTLLWESPAEIRPLGYAPDAFQGRSTFELVHPDDADQVRHVLAQAAQHPATPQRGVFRLRRRDGLWCWVEASATNLLDDESVQAIVVNYRDITKRKQAEDMIKSQLDELTRWQDVMLGREDRVQELKREINELCRRAGEAVRYPSQPVGPADPEAVDPNV